MQCKGVIRAIAYVRYELSPNYVPLSPLPLKVGVMPPAPLGAPPICESHRLDRCDFVIPKLLLQRVQYRFTEILRHIRG